MKKLENTDPELFKYLEQNDKKLLNFRVDQEDSEGEEKPEIEDDEKTHKPGAQELEVASDESDFEKDEVDEDDKKKKKGNVVTIKLLKDWQQQLSSEIVPVETIRSVIKAFNSTLLSLAADPNVQGEYKVDGSAIFNGVIQLCVLFLERGIRTYLGLKKSNIKDIQKCKKFSKIKHVLRMYLVDVTKILEQVSSSNILSVLLKHLHQISGILTAFSTITKPILKRLIKIWSTGEESIRILAFLCILKITRNQQDLFLNQVLKSMYMEYVRNSKFVSPNTLPAINFMRRSLTELFSLDLNVAYQHVFLFIRQLAIHLRNACILQKKEHFQQVYNWQYLNSLKLWGDVLSIVAQGSGKSDSKARLTALIYPFVSIVCGVIKLKPSANYFPLRFHCVKILIDLSRATKVFIPIMPFILEVLHANTFKQQHKKLSMKPLSFTCLLRIQKGHLDENSFRDEIIEQVYGLTLECLINDCTCISFPDLVVPHVMTIKDFIKETKNPNYNKKLKTLCDKISEQSQFVDSRRNKVNFSLNDMSLIKSWEINLRTGTTPLEVFYDNWKKSNQKKMKRQSADTLDEEEDHDYGNLPKIKPPKAKKQKIDGPPVLFPSDDESDDGEINFDAGSDSESEEEIVQSKKSKKNGKSNEMEVESPEESENGVEGESGDENGQSYFDQGDIVEDLSIDNW